MTDAPKTLRGFAALSPARRREIAAMGGKAGAGSQNRPWSLNPELAKEMAAKGGKKSRRPSKKVLTGSV